MMKFSLFSMITTAAIALGGCTTGSDDVSYNETDFHNGGGDAPELNERTMTFMEPENSYSNVDTYKPKTLAEKEAMHQRWNTARMDTRWEEYRGSMVRVQVLLGNSDLREMRLRLMQNSNGTDSDRDIRGVLTRVADFEMKKVCGRNADSYIIVYDKPSFDVMRPNPYFEYAIEADGVAMREYGFRCIYNN